ncbi:C40 family peptidase [Actinomadura latina]|uniref:C40 family peptidase n=1 Tax=Actinomadura latina TaxID=163603 RepID=A0A846ZEA0_9ACTN|nr:C40 family peptidase [Actinomadura latina]NKZ08905.1 C40 family peptidase [Actinomadura latina]
MKGKHSKRSGRLGLSPRANGALVGLAVFGVAATSVHAVKAPQEPGTTVAAVHTIPKPRKAAPAESEPDERSQVIKRAKAWNPHSGDRVPYSQTGYHEGYRTDCSGFVAMTLGLPKPGPNTVGLTSSRFTERIKMSELKKGDLVMDAEGTNTTRHVVIFEKWADGEHTSYWAYEQRGRYGTDYRTRDYGLSSGSEYKAYRPVKLSDA